MHPPLLFPSLPSSLSPSVSRSSLQLLRSSLSHTPSCLCTPRRFLPRVYYSSLPPISSSTPSSLSSPPSSQSTSISNYASARPLIALGIETSCDDTCAAIVTSDRRILSEVLRTQHHLHEPMGGIVPKLAHHAHMRNLPAVVQEAIQQANLGEQGILAIDLIAVTRGPGLAHSLGVGLNAAKTLAAALNKPLIGVHHMEAHALTARLTTQDPDLIKNSLCSDKPEPATLIGSDPYPSFPFLTLLVSGGHTMLLIAHSVDRYTTLATTVDDSIGDAFDKTARELQIPWIAGRAGGPGASLEEFAKGSKNPERYLDQLPIPMSLRNNKHEMKFSFAGLKASVTRIVNQEKDQALLKGTEAGLRPDEIVFMDEDKRRDLAAGFQYCAVTHLGQKVTQGLKQCREQGLDISSLVISGGVGRNATVRSKMEQVCDPESLYSTLQHPQQTKNKSKSKSRSKIGNDSQKQLLPWRKVQVICPPPKLCTDNAVMIAWTGIERFRLGLVDPYDIDIVPKWPLDMLGTGVIPE